MEVLSTTAASSDDDDIVVNKRNSCHSASRRHSLPDSDADSSPSKPSLAPSADTDSEGDSSVKSPSRTNTRSIGKHNGKEKSDTKGSTSSDSDDADILGNKRKSSQSAPRRHCLADSDEDSSSSSHKPPLTAAAETSLIEKHPSIRSLTSTSINNSRAIKNQNGNESDEIASDQNYKKHKLQRRRVIRDQSDSDEDIEQSTVLQKSPYQNVRSPSSSKLRKIAGNRDDSKIPDKSESDQENTKENKLPRKMAIRGRTDSYKETQNSTVLKKSDSKESTSSNSDEEDIVRNNKKCSQSMSRRHHLADSDEDSTLQKKSPTAAETETSHSEKPASIKSLTSTSIENSKAFENQDGNESDKIGSDENDKKHKLQRRRVIRDQSDSDEDIEQSTVLQKSPSQNVRSPSSFINRKMMRKHDASELSDNSESDQDNTKENKLPKKTVIAGRSDNYEDTQNSTILQKSQPRKGIVFDSDSDSDTHKITKPSRVSRKDKMMDKIRKTFEKKAENAEAMKNIMKPLSSICDKESSSEEEPPEALNESIDNIKQSYNSVRTKNRPFQKSEQKDDDSKHKRMSAKEAMENMTKIKSESNRMLRERRVTLPYHRPRQVSLKDILSRKRASVPARGNLSFKMNKEQLEQYALQLEESQKQMSKLYKSEDEEDEANSEEAENKMDADDHFTEIIQIHAQSQKDISKADVENTDDKTDNALIKPNSDIERMEIEEISIQNVTVISRENTEIDISEDTNYLLVNMDSELSSKASTGTELSEVLTEPVPLEKNTELDSQNMYLHFSENTEIDNQQKNSALGSALEIDERSSKSEKSPMNKEKSPDDIKKNKSLEISDEAETTSLSENKSLVSNGFDAENEKDSMTEGITLRLDTSDASNKEEHMKESMDEETRENQDQSKENVEEKSKEINFEKEQDYSFDDDFPSDDIDQLMNQIESEKGVDDSPMLMRDMTPRLHGAPGTMIDLDAPTPQQQKLTGVDMLKQRYMYFSKLKTAEEEEREKELKMKPGSKHLQLKHELERQIAEQSIAEWNKRLEEERLQQRETAAINGELSDCEDELEKMEAELEEGRNDVENGIIVEKDGKEDIGGNNDEDVHVKEDDNENNENEETNDLEEGEEEFDDTEKKAIKHAKTRKTANPLIDDEAEVSDDDDNCVDEDENDADESESSDEESSSSEEETADDKKPKKGRIIKAFEDSDDEELKEDSEVQTEKNLKAVEMKARAEKTESVNSLENQTPDLFESQTTEGDEDIPLAQPIPSNSEEMNESFTEATASGNHNGQPTACCERPGLNFETQMDMEAILGMCSGTFPTESQHDLPPVPPSIPRLEVEISTQVIGEDILHLCSGTFGEDTVGTQTVNNENIDHVFDTQVAPVIYVVNPFDDLEGPDTHAPNIKKFFGPDLNLNASDRKEEKVKDNTKNLHKEEVTELLQKGKLVIESSDEEKEGTTETKKKMKRKKPKKRTLLISDDEEEYSEEEQSPLGDNVEQERERIVEYDSEENEVELPITKVSKYKRMASDFMEKEAELSSEDEWMGSGDEDERGLDRMEREAGDEDVFHQGQLQRELGQMHMQDIMDQDKREVRMLQEILLEDGDLQGGSRQRKFRWNIADGDEQLGMVPDEFGDTPEEERESEEWRKQRHERQLFLRQMAEKQKSEDDVLGMGFEETSLVTSSLCLSTVSSVSMERTSTVETVEIDENVQEVGTEKKPSSKDLPSPVKNSFSIMQEQYRNLVSGNARSSLQRLAALVEPASEKPVHNVSSLAPGKQRTFVFATLTQPERQLDDEIPVQKKRKAVDAGTPKLIKKLRVEEKPRKSLLDHLGA